ncbi:secretory lipase-domain-containing protein [Talaromyces proteolyticus]|uniref:Secretory lipase-domain-containing protein n=1 Tax=Talaromyces proteolyticus TaxID=1131652 RepID=A0AAD4KYT1_9EURO|nr:secretory lipase-domain-containing protein [Talaromyces proteolyticus]KAH8703124.1 secretory lipase-domain-containing protein [Talaromyces proteolyticus]
MRCIYCLTFPLLYLATVSNGQSVDRVSPLPPSVDAFYQPPPSFETASPGTILRSRRVPPTTRVNTTALADTYQLLLRSRDSQGAPTAIVTTVFIPPNAASDKLLEIQFAYDSASVDCSPSYTLFQNDTSLPEAITVSAGLQQGWNVAVTDYEGFTASFSNGLRAGYSMLDATRACLSSKNITGIDDNAKVVLAGTSGGALASEWALELQASYAPELKFAGALLTALTPNASSVFGTIDGTADAGLIASGVLGLAKEYLNISDWLSENLVQGDALRLSQAAHSCIVDTISVFNNTDFVPFFDVPSFLTATVPNSVIQNTGIMGLHGVPAAPIYNYKGTADEVSVVEDTDALVEKFCGEGADIEYYRALNASHGSAGAHGFLAGWSWINDRMNGVPVLGGCQTYNVTIPT